jgi:hypothetical protein
LVIEFDAIADAPAYGLSSTTASAPQAKRAFQYNATAPVVAGRRSASSLNVSAPRFALPP